MKMKKIPLLCTLLISFLGTACDKETDNDIDLSGSMATDFTNLK